MIDTSAAFQTAIKADTELTVLEADFGFIPPGAVEGSTVTASAQNPMSRLSQVNNDQYGMSAKWATLEHNRHMLDGSYALFDDGDMSQQIGFISNNLCDDDGMFASPPYLDYTMDAAYDLIGIMVFFDEPGEEWATNCTVTYYNASGVQLAQQTFDNDSAIALFDMTQTGVKRIRLTINTWSFPQRMAKVPTLLPGQIFYLGKYAYSFEHTEAITVFDPSITFPEFVIKFDNSEKKFDIVNPQGLMSFLRQKMQINARFKTLLADGTYEYVSAGTYYLYAWPENTQEDEASFTCKPSMAFATGYYANTTRGTQTVTQAAATIFAGASESYVIDSALQGITVNQYIGDKVPLINAMGQLAVACCGYWFIDRDGSYHLKAWEAPSITNLVDYDNAWEKPDISQRKRVTSVNVPYTAYDIDDNLDVRDNIVSLPTNDGEMEEIQSAFIHDGTRSTIVANAALEYYALRLEFESSYRGDPSIQAGDGVTVENDYGYSDIIVTGHDLTWDENGLDGVINGLGV